MRRFDIVKGTSSPNGFSFATVFCCADRRFEFDAMIVRRQFSETFEIEIEPEMEPVPEIIVMDGLPGLLFPSVGGIAGRAGCVATIGVGDGVCPAPGVVVGGSSGELFFGGEVGAGEVGAGEVGAGEVGAGEVGAGEVGAGEVGAGEVGAGEVGTIVGRRVGTAVGIAVGATVGKTVGNGVAVGDGVGVGVDVTTCARQVLLPLT